MTREELHAAVSAVLDDVVTADPGRIDPGWEDTIMLAADSYAASQIALAVIPAGPARGEPAP